MCRFLLAKSNNKLNTKKLLTHFASMCETCRAPDGDWQGDGFGIAWKNENEWKLVKSLKPIWEEKDLFNQVSDTYLFVAHARSAGFPQHKGIIEYNQPFIEGDLCFVFNGMIRGVRLTMSLEGTIGAQKIFSLIKNLLYNEKIETVLKKVDELLLENTTKIEGMNIGLIKGNIFHVLCQYADNADYFGIRYFQEDSTTLVCSQPIGNFNWQTMKKGETFHL